VDEDREFAAFRLNNANHVMLRELIARLMEAEVIEPDVAARVVKTAIEQCFPQEESSGRQFDMAREMMLAVERALASYRPVPRTPHGGGSPRKDLG